MNVKYFSGAGILLLGGSIFKQFIFYPKFPFFKSKNYQKITSINKTVHSLKLIVNDKFK